MLRVYFDDELIDVEAYTELDNEYKLFTDTFKLGSVASNTFKLSVLKTAVNSQPANVRIEDDDTVMNFVVDNVTEDDYVYAYTLTDKLLSFNFNYDASELINSKAELGEDCYLSDIWKDMCDKANVEYDETYVFENDIVVNWYDSRVQARRYLSYIAELQSGYACILENGKQSFKKQNRPSIKTIDADECSDLIVGEKKKITRVVYDGGAFKWEFGDETGETLYLQKDNVFIVNEELVENIYNNIKDFEFYIIDVPQAPMDSTIKAGDVITFDDNGKLYQTIAQYTMSYAGGWVGSYKISVNTERQQETQVSRVADNVKNLQVDVNRLDNEFNVVSEEIIKLTDFIRNVGMTGNYLRLEETAESNGAINKLSIKGFELMPLYPGMAYPSEYTYPGVLNFYTLIFDTINTFDNNPHYVYVNSPVPLQKLGSVYDELLIESNKVKVIQRIGYDFDNEQWSVLSTPIIHELNDVLLPTFDGDTYISVRYFDNLVYNAEYLIKNDLTSNFTTQLESSSQFNLSANQVVLKVDNRGNMVEAKLSADANLGSSFKVKADDIDFESYEFNLTSNHMSIVSDNFNLKDDGQATMKINGEDIFNHNGVLTNLTFPCYGFYGGYDWLGYAPDTVRAGYTYYSADLIISADIPTNFVIQSAYITLTHTPIRWADNDEGMTEYWGYSRNIKAYKMANNDAPDYYMMYASGYYIEKSSLSGIEISNAFGSSGYTATNTSSATYETTNSIDIASSLAVGSNTVILRSADAVQQNNTWCIQRTGMAKAVLNVIGYMKI